MDSKLNQVRTKKLHQENEDHLKKYTRKTTVLLQGHHPSGPNQHNPFFLKKTSSGFFKHGEANSMRPSCQVQTHYLGSFRFNTRSAVVRGTLTVSRGGICKQKHSYLERHTVHGGDDAVQRPLHVAGGTLGHLALEAPGVDHQHRHVAPQQPPSGPGGSCSRRCQ